MNILGHASNVSNMNYRFLDANGIPSGVPQTFTGPDFSADFHTFTVEWMPTYVKFYVDGVQRGGYTGDFILRDPAFIILNMAVGGSLAGTPDAGT